MLSPLMLRDILEEPPYRSYDCYGDHFENPFSFANSPFHRQTSAKSESNFKFQVLLNVKQFRPDEIDVKTVDNFVIIHGKHEEQPDEHGFVSREFTRRYELPDDVEPEKVKSSLSKARVLTIEAPRKVPEPLPKNERIVPIKIQRPVGYERDQKFIEEIAKIGKLVEEQGQNNKLLQDF